ncbi:hypothetical protein ACWCQ0_51730, partial [Streptomyces massasporeus]
YTPSIGSSAQAPPSGAEALSPPAPPSNSAAPPAGSAGSSAPPESSPGVLVEQRVQGGELLVQLGDELRVVLRGDRLEQVEGLLRALDKYRTDKSGYVFTSYDKVGKAERKELSDGVNALAEPLSKLSAAVVK